MTELIAWAEEARGERRLEMLRFLYAQLKCIHYDMMLNEAEVNRRLNDCKINVLQGDVLTADT
ncbi:unnamed protein product [Symbiodinium sp. CCMP2592]|nr:unnamed protein product [Symbiodinium sp. CCMP2592]